MADLSLEALMREETGRSATRRLRKAGRTPAIVYGGGKSDLPITLNSIEITNALNKEAFHTSMLEINVDGVKETQTVLLKETQWDPVTDIATHLDFFRVLADDIVHVEVPVVAINHEDCPGVVKGGMLDLIRHVLEVSCRADAIPERVEIDCSKLEVGDTVHVDDIELPDGVTIQHEVNFTVLNLSMVKVAAVAAAEESDDTAEATEGEAEASS